MKLIVYPPAFGEINGSPFCVKAMCLMQLSGLAYDLEIQADPRKQPKGKLPVLVDGEMVIPDSDMIREHLQARHGVDFDDGLDAGQTAASRMIIRAVEEHLYFLIVANRWQDPAHWPYVRDAFFAGVPWLLRPVITRVVRRKVIRQITGQGAGRYTPAERLGRAEKDVVAVERLLGDKPFLFGASPTAADASVVPMLRALAIFPVDNPMSDLVLERPTLARYIERGQRAMYPAMTRLARAA